MSPEEIAYFNRTWIKDPSDSSDDDSDSEADPWIEDVTPSNHAGIMAFRHPIVKNMIHAEISNLLADTTAALASIGPHKKSKKSTKKKSKSASGKKKKSASKSGKKKKH